MSVGGASVWNISGFHRQLWTAEAGHGASVTFTYTAADGEGGYPGKLTARVTYTWCVPLYSLMCHHHQPK
eukprot:8990479-Pyramimonas_sp.AAC.2